MRSSFARSLAPERQSQIVMKHTHTYTSRTSRARRRPLRSRTRPRKCAPPRGAGATRSPATHSSPPERPSSAESAAEADVGGRARTERAVNRSSLQGLPGCRLPPTATNDLGHCALCVVLDTRCAFCSRLQQKQCSLHARRSSLWAGDATSSAACTWPCMMTLRMAELHACESVLAEASGFATTFAPYAPSTIMCQHMRPWITVDIRLHRPTPHPLLTAAHRCGLPGVHIRHSLRGAKPLGLAAGPHATTAPPARTVKVSWVRDNLHSEGGAPHLRALPRNHGDVDLGIGHDLVGCA